MTTIPTRVGPHTPHNLLDCDGHDGGCSCYSPSKCVTCMEQITISKFIFDSLVESVEDLKQVLNRVNYDSDHTDPRNIESCPAYTL